MLCESGILTPSTTKEFTWITHVVVLVLFETILICDPIEDVGLVNGNNIPRVVKSVDLETIMNASSTRISRKVELIRNLSEKELRSIRGTGGKRMS